MAATYDMTHSRPLHPLHVILLAGTIPLFLGALLSDVAYARTYHVQWTNFASWLIAGALVFGGLALFAALIGLFRAGERRARYAVYFVLLLATWVVGFINALIHAKDAWASMPTGLVLSAVVTVLAFVATWIGLTRARSGATT